MSRRKTYFGCDFVVTEEEAKLRCACRLTTYTPYMKQKYDLPCYTEWHSLDGKEHKYVVWYYYQV